MALLQLDILVVDDNFGSAFMMAEVFKRAGHQVRVAFGGNEAIRAAATQAPDVILMDINLPDLGGFEAAKRIKTLMPQVRVIGMSGLHVPPEMEGDMLIFEERLHKPIRPEQLLSTLDHLFEPGCKFE
ncbi:response regulator [Ramlibacter henchirensis]|uniref:Response regulator n=1 Tax=Ramlibacter henchirensis TaxID=204072 RepID=A0A4Z0BSK8_9BURK|nr:response regulator [Ramlibacter henchirensis]TFZ00979.1 response regulator [Ramlibacter henchirensis]